MTSANFSSRRDASWAVALSQSAWTPIALVALQIIVWVSLGVIFQGSIDQDIAEGVADGPAWQLSYLRHPPLSSWLSGLASTTGAARYVVLFAIALSFACGAFAVAAVFVQRKDGGAAGLITLLAGLSSPYAMYWPHKFNHNIGIMPFWALTICAAWRAFDLGTIGAWATFGLVVGLSLWAKYAILQLVVPLIVLFFTTKDWRKQIATPGPWIAVVLCSLIIAPQMIDVWAKGATTMKWAVHTLPSGPMLRLGWMLQWALACVLANVTMATLAVVACGRKPLAVAIRTTFARQTQTRFDLFLHVATFGPALAVLLAGPFGIRLFYHWVTPLAVGFAIWWGHVASRAGLREPPRRVWLLFAGWAALSIVGYVALREIAPRQKPLDTSAYSEFDGPALAREAEAYWAAHGQGPIPYIVSYGGKVGFQAGGSIAFDLPYRVRVLIEGSTSNAPWIDADDIRRKGALIVSGTPLTAVETINDKPIDIEAITTIVRPVMRGAVAPPFFYLGVLKGSAP